MSKPGFEARSSKLVEPSTPHMTPYSTYYTIPLIVRLMVSLTVAPFGRCESLKAPTSMPDIPRVVARPMPGTRGDLFRQD